MPNRYKETGTKKREDGKRVYSSTLYPKIPESDNDVFIQTSRGDRLDLLANEHYGDVSLWWIIAQANNLPASFSVEPGIQLRIPKAINRIFNELEKIQRNG